MKYFKLPDLGEGLNEAEIVQRFKLDTLMRLLSEDELNRWSDMKDATIHELALTQHRAENDVLLLHETFKRIKSR